MNLYLDIETNIANRPEVLAYIAATAADDLATALAEVKAPGNYKDEAKIAEFIVSKRAELQAEHEKTIAAKVSKTGLDGAFGRVCVIGWAFNDGKPRTLLNAENEAALLTCFAEEISEAINHSAEFSACVIGHNVSSFDLRFLVQRFIVNGIRPPMVVHRAAQAKPWESDRVFDTMVQWAGVGNRISLDKLCLALGVPSPKGDMDGSMVAEYVAAGRIAEVAAYCERDVEAARAVHQRMTFATA